MNPLVRDEKVKVLKAIRPMEPEEVLRSPVRGQYGEGALGGKKGAVVWLVDRAAGGAREPVESAT